MGSFNRGPLRRTMGVWLLILAAGIALLYGRYDWGTHQDRFPERALAMSSYLFVIVLPTVYYLLRRLIGSTRVAGAVTAVVFVVMTLPYHVLGLDQYFYYRNRPPDFTLAQFPPSLQFLPDGALRAFPFDWLFMTLLFVTGAAIVWGAWLLRRNAGLFARRKAPVLLTVAFAAICLQSYVHTSMRSPYTYLAHFQAKESVHKWYHVYQFADGSGATQGDDYVFFPLEQYFQAVQSDGDNELVRRPMSFYIASQGSYFVNRFYVWLALNCLFWLAAVLATARLVMRLATERAGVIAGALTVVGPGFVAFVGTPAMYLQYYVAVAVALCLFEDLIARPPDRRKADFLLFTGVLTVCALVYDLLPLVFVLLAYGVARKVPWKPLVASLAVATAATHGFTVLVTAVKIRITTANGDQATDGLSDTINLLLHPSLSRWYDTVVQVLSSYVALLLHAMFLLPVLVALFGIRLVKDRPRRVLAGGMLAASILTMAVLQIGKTSVGFVPRLVYPMFPVVYLLAAMALDTTGFKVRAAGPPLGKACDRFRVAAPWILVGAMFVLVNADIFGYPSQYVEFFVNKPAAFQP